MFEASRHGCFSLDVLTDFCAFFRPRYNPLASASDDATHRTRVRAPVSLISDAGIRLSENAVSLAFLGERSTRICTTQVLKQRHVAEEEALCQLLIRRSR
jgi:hypothetical protein